METSFLCEVGDDISYLALIGHNEKVSLQFSLDILKKAMGFQATLETNV